MNPDAKAWSLLTKTRGGVVSILRDLTLAECRQAYHRLNPQYGVTVTSFKSLEGGTYTDAVGSLLPSHIEIREVFGPGGWDRNEVRTWDAPWPKYVTVEADDPNNPYRDVKAPTWVEKDGTIFVTSGGHPTSRPLGRDGWLR
jgi:hypothetical protein